jgi:EAL domain-containing protein (putative c-di-GMP-specific phosphodiesterase class I)
VQIGIDRFGTGYSSLTYLKHFPVRFLKIDKTFIDGLDEGNSADTAIVDAILRLGEALSLQTIAEGVESTEQLAWLRRAGCSAAQGYLFGKLVAAESLTL